MNNSVAQIIDASKTYYTGDSTLVALQPTSIDVYSHELMLLMGPSGSGKTTLLSLLGCVIYPTSGSVIIGGKNISQLSENELSALRLSNIGFVFQNYNLIAPFTSLDNVEFPLMLQGVDDSTLRQRAIEALRTVGMEKRATYYPKMLSGGEQQRVAIARALVSNAPMILCDEPTAALDHDSGEQVMIMLKKLSTEGRAVIVVTHDTRLIPYADRIVYIEGGAISFTPFNT